MPGPAQFKGGAACLIVMLTATTFPSILPATIGPGLHGPKWKRSAAGRISTASTAHGRQEPRHAPLVEALDLHHAASCWLPR
jgi:hypothetical protein